jgi:hypothetical protein
LERSLFTLLKLKPIGHTFIRIPLVGPSFRLVVSLLLPMVKESMAIALLVES